MNVVEVILLVGGVAVFVASFLVGNSKKDDRKEIVVTNNNELSEEDKARIQEQIEGIIRDKMENVTEQTEAKMDKISNTKMLELNDYAETIMGEINKNHNETVFLYDMLNEKAKEVKNTVKDVNIAKKEVVRITSQQTADAVSDAHEPSTDTDDKVVSAQNNAKETETKQSTPSRKPESFGKDAPGLNNQIDSSLYNNINKVSDGNNQYGYKTPAGSKDLAKERLMELVRNSSRPSYRPENYSEPEVARKSEKSVADSDKSTVGKSLTSSKNAVERQSKTATTGIELARAAQASRLAAEAAEAERAKKAEAEKAETEKAETEKVEKAKDAKEAANNFDAVMAAVKKSEEAKSEAESVEVVTDVKPALEPVKKEEDDKPAAETMNEEVSVKNDAEFLKETLAGLTSDENVKVTEPEDKGSDETVDSKAGKDKILTDVKEEVMTPKTEVKKTRSKTVKAVDLSEGDDGESVAPKKSGTRRTVSRKVASSQAGELVKMTAPKVEDIVAGFDENMTNSDKIMELSRHGISNKEIAKVLNIGLGEVRLVVDLLNSSD